MEKYKKYKKYKNSILYFIMKQKIINFIKNLDLPSCNKCKHFIQYKTRELYVNPNEHIQLSKCNKYGYKDLVTGEIEYEYANNCRKSNHKCKKTGVYYEEK